MTALVFLFMVAATAAFPVALLKFASAVAQ